MKFREFWQTSDLSRTVGRSPERVSAVRGQILELHEDSVGISPHRGVFCSWSWWQRWIWIKICNLKDGGYGDQDRGIWEKREDIIIIRGRFICTQAQTIPTAAPPNLPLVCSHTHYACKAFIVQPGCGPEDPSPADWAGWRVTARQRRVPPPSPLFEINHTGFHIQCPPPKSPSLTVLTVGLGQLLNRVPMLNCLSPFQDESQRGHSVSDHADRGSEAAVRGGARSSISHGCLCMLRSLSHDVWSLKALLFFLDNYESLWHPKYFGGFIQQQQQKLDSL